MTKNVKTLAIFTSLLVCFFQKANSQSSAAQINMALVNGCNDSKRVIGGQTFGNTYYSIINNNSIKADYKDAYREAYTRCHAGGKYYWKKDKLVYEGPKFKKDKSIKAGIYSFKTYLGALKK
ncbi:MAG: hypothetical protein AB8B59_08750 [Maribacter sp.]